MTKKLINKEWFLLILPLMGYLISVFKFMFDMKKFKISYVRMCLYIYLATFVSAIVPMVGIVVVFNVFNYVIGGFVVPIELGIIVAIFLFVFMELLLLIFKTSILNKYYSNI